MEERFCNWEKRNNNKIHRKILLFPDRRRNQIDHILIDALFGGSEILIRISKSRMERKRTQRAQYKPKN